MKPRRTKEQFMKDCKTISVRINSIKKKIGYFPTYREMQHTLDLSYQGIYDVVQEAITQGWVSEEIAAHYGRKTK
jgi:hypothetical protein